MADHFLQSSKRNQNSQSETKFFESNLESYICRLLPKSDAGNRGILSDFGLYGILRLLEHVCACTFLQKSLSYSHLTSRCKQLCSRYESLKDSKT